HWVLFMILSHVFPVSTAVEVCFDQLGCFTDLPPWGGTVQRPVSVLPWSPKEIGTRFLLFTPNNRYYQFSSNPCCLICCYVKDMLRWEYVNCIAVEWKTGVKTHYAQAANNARVVAAQVVSMITFLRESFNQTANKFHIIGHSLGAHAAGEAGSRIPGLARITGLDPVEPYFQDTDSSVCLDMSDAAFVDVIHTDGLPFDSKLGLGMMQPVGHIDFYPNGGGLMPGCSANKGRPTDLDAIWEGTRKFDACNHGRAYQYYRESIDKSQGFVAFPCADEDSFAAGKCFPCTNSKCPLMGHSADRFTLTDDISKTKYFLNTGSSQPFGRYSYRVTVMLDGPSWPNPGFMFVALTGDKKDTKEHRCDQCYNFCRGTLMPGRTYEVLIDAEVDVGDVMEVKFRWNNHIWNPMKPKYGAAKVELQRGKDGNVSFFCGTENVQENVVQSVLQCHA
uniref:Triacylglycerol lipase n=1 Tax=Echeneis naucrates TaxID=173247 RepID=A0A665TEI3_ECHNA